MNATRMQLDDRRWHWQHGPIDLIVSADGDAAAVMAAHEAGWQRFTTVLAELVSELPLLKRAIAGDAAQADNPCQGSVARRMWQACHSHRARYITPMAAVAGSVADELIEAFQRTGVRRAFVNNGGDIALHLGQNESYRVGVFSDLATFGGTPLDAADALDANITLDYATPVRGVATSGWRGRSFSLGIADSVTVLAPTAARADAAATMIANAVDVDHAGIVRRPASSLKDESDLGDIPVTVDVPALPRPLIDVALERGAVEAARLFDLGLIEGAALFLQWRTRVIGTMNPGDTLRASGAGGTRRINQQTEAPCSKYAAC
ncbi:ApbE superfamily uncharacterized protein (UPF0280 family) [Paraburkholderia sp. GAS448]|uniref:UPF0280 family protein n=1 Tax=Paraburkholderia sp. GAS448 TaxID=3035136 RepID=UPI003D261706